MAKRILAVAGGAPELSEYPLGILLARSIIDHEQHNSAIYYAWLYGQALGRKCTISTSDATRGGDVELPNEEKIEAAFRKCKNAMLAVGRRACDALENIAVFNREPYWLKREMGRVHHVRGAEIAERKALADALSALVAVHRHGDQRAAA
jgi:hypothetical protein